MSRDEVIERRIAEAPVLHLKLMTRAYAGKAGKADAIKATCLHCVGFDIQAVRNCTGYSCPMWSYRPYQVKR